MKSIREKGILCVVLLAVMVLTGPAEGNQPLTVTGGEPVTYACANGDRLVARYFSLSDDSLRFVKILFPDGREYTLPQVISGSGARYTDDGELLWWIKGDEARAEVRDENGEWKELCGECRVLP